MVVRDQQRPFDVAVQLRHFDDHGCDPPLDLQSRRAHFWQQRLHHCRLGLDPSHKAQVHPGDVLPVEIDRNGYDAFSPSVARRAYCILIAADAIKVGIRGSRLRAIAGGGAGCGGK